MAFDQSTASRKIRVASYNIRKCIGLDRRRDPGRVLDVINGIGADVIALQEADRRLGTRPAALPARMIDAHSDLEPVSLAENGCSLGWHGNVLLLRKGTPLSGSARLDLPGLEPRGAVLAEIVLPNGRPLRIVGVHLGLLRRHRTAQLGAIRDQIEGRTAMPTVIMGDFNEWSPTRGLETLEKCYSVHAPGHSFHAARPVAALDRIAVGDGLDLIDAGVAETSNSRRASDHLPVWADVSH